MKRLFALLLAAVLSGGCVFAHVEDATMLGVGKVTAEHGCIQAEEAAGAAEVTGSTGDTGCTKIEGQGFTEGFMKFLSDALTVIPRMMAGAAAGAVITQ